MISSKYNWIGALPGLPKMVVEAFKLGKLNTSEIEGAASNPVIMQLAKEAGVEDIYTSDEIAWCAVAQVALTLRAGKIVPFGSYDRLRAKSFLKFGEKVKVAMLGDVLVFNRDGGYHVGIYIAEDEKCYHVAGGNQSNQYNIIRIEKSRLVEARRPEYKIGVPTAVKQIFVDAIGAMSKNEA